MAQSVGVIVRVTRMERSRRGVENLRSNEDVGLDNTFKEPILFMKLVLLQDAERTGDARGVRRASEPEYLVTMPQPSSGASCRTRFDLAQRARNSLRSEIRDYSLSIFPPLTWNCPVQDVLYHLQVAGFAVPRNVLGQ